MNQPSSFDHCIDATLKALSKTLALAAKDVEDAIAHSAQQETHAAIGAVMPVLDTLNQSLALYHALIAMHRCKRQAGA